MYFDHGTDMAEMLLPSFATLALRPWSCSVEGLLRYFHRLLITCARTLGKHVQH